MALRKKEVSFFLLKPLRKKLRKRNIQSRQQPQQGIHLQIMAFFVAAVLGAANVVLESELHLFTAHHWRV